MFPDDRLTITAWLDPGTGHIAFRASAASPERGVFGVQFPIANLHADHDFIIPSFSGMMVNRRMTTGLKTFGGLRNFLEARVVGIEGRKPGSDDEPSNLWPERHVHMWRVPLGEFAGQPVLITLGTDSRKCTNADNFWWSRPILIRDAQQAEAYVVLTDEGEIAEEPSRVLDADFVLHEGTGRTPCGY